MFFLLSLAYCREQRLSSGFPRAPLLSVPPEGQALQWRNSRKPYVILPEVTHIRAYNSGPEKSCSPSLRDCRVLQILAMVYPVDSGERGGDTLYFLGRGIF